MKRVTGTASGRSSKRPRCERREMGRRLAVPGRGAGRRAQLYANASSAPRPAPPRPAQLARPGRRGGCPGRGLGGAGSGEAELAGKRERNICGRNRVTKGVLLTSLCWNSPDRGCQLLPGPGGGGWEACGALSTASANTPRVFHRYFYNGGSL